MPRQREGLYMNIRHRENSHFIDILQCAQSPGFTALGFIIVERTDFFPDKVYDSERSQAVSPTLKGDQAMRCQ